MVATLLVILELTKLTKTNTGNKLKKELIRKFLEPKVKEIDRKNVNIESLRIQLYKAFETEMKKELERINALPIGTEEIRSSFMLIMLKRYCINSTFNLGVVSILGGTKVAAQPSPIQVTRRYLKSIKRRKGYKSIEILSSVLYNLNERILMASIIIKFLQTIKYCIFTEKQVRVNSKSLVIPDLTSIHSNRSEKNSLITRSIEYFGCRPDANIYYMGQKQISSQGMTRLKQPYSVEFRGKQRVEALKLTIRYALKCFRYLLKGNYIERALLKDLYIYELCKINPLDIQNIIYTQSSKWNHELWPHAYSRKRKLICYGGSFWGFKTKKFGYLDQYCYLKYQKWDEILCWNEILGKFESNLMKKNPKIIIIDPITPLGRMHKGCAYLSKQVKEYILLFDSLPYSIFGRLCTNLGERYRTEDICSQFINDILDEAEQSKVSVILKTKRDIELAVPYYSIESYFKMLKKHEKNQRLHIANKNIDISELIEKSLVVISAPFTSTSLYSSKVYNKPAYFYDPSKQLYADDRAAMNLPLVQGRDELKQLFRNI